ncbi:MAG: methyltransferase domain-containing protein [Pseudomonadales bacterium]|nr:class I SAM-dependent methyltransferase [Pseudomonadales bacterium]NIX06671.1 methyltransferase domain-containing protein [Pseudomonadales bacterium]
MPNDGMTLADQDREKWDKRYAAGAYAERTHPSAFVGKWLSDLPAGDALDIACGAGRNALYMAERGFRVDAVDVSAEALARAASAAAEAGLEVNWIQCDLDTGLPVAGPFDLIVMIRYVNEPLLRSLPSMLRPGGVLIVENHLTTEEAVIGPRDPRYRVMPGALPAAVPDLEVLEATDSVVDDPDGRKVGLARLVARKS